MVLRGTKSRLHGCRRLPNCANGLFYQKLEQASLGDFSEGYFGHLTCPIADRNISITPLASPSEDPGDESRDLVRATGWGKTSNTGGISEKLMFVDEPVLSKEKCSDYFGSIITDQHICIDSTTGGVCNVSTEYTLQGLRKPYL